MKASDEDFRGSSEAMLDMINNLQSERIDSQRAELRPGSRQSGQETPPVRDTAPGTSLPGLRAHHTTRTKPEDDFLEMIARVQGSRLEDQRTELPRVRRGLLAPNPGQKRTPSQTPQRPKATITVPDDEFFALLMRAQRGRMEDQRAVIPARKNNETKF